MVANKHLTRLLAIACVTVSVYACPAVSGASNLNFLTKCNVNTSSSVSKIKLVHEYGEYRWFAVPNAYFHDIGLTGYRQKDRQELRAITVMINIDTLCPQPSSWLLPQHSDVAKIDYRIALGKGLNEFWNISYAPFVEPIGDKYGLTEFRKATTRLYSIVVGDEIFYSKSQNDRIDTIITCPAGDNADLLCGMFVDPGDQIVITINFSKRRLSDWKLISSDAQKLLAAISQ